MKRFNVTILVEDTINKRKKALGMSAKHGLSTLISRIKPQTSSLMDTGQSSDMILIDRFGKRIVTLEYSI
jgi:metal-dependent hydrolase (beta-lactamase superfamily II)